MKREYGGCYKSNPVAETEMAGSALRAYPVSREAKVQAASAASHSELPVFWVCNVRRHAIPAIEAGSCMVHRYPHDVVHGELSDCCTAGQTHYERSGRGCREGACCCGKCCK